MLVDIPIGLARELTLFGPLDESFNILMALPVSVSLKLSHFPRCANNAEPSREKRPIA